MLQYSQYIMIAIIRSGGKQFLVKPDQTVVLEKLKAAEGDLIEFETLLVSDEAGKKVEIGMPTLSGKRVTGKIVAQGKGKKVDVIKFKSKVRYARKYGHRQPFTSVMIQSVA